MGAPLCRYTLLSHREPGRKRRSWSSKPRAEARQCEASSILLEKERGKWRSAPRACFTHLAALASCIEVTTTWSTEGESRRCLWWSPRACFLGVLLQC